MAVRYVALRPALDQSGGFLTRSGAIVPSVRRQPSRSIPASGPLIGTGRLLSWQALEMLMAELSLTEEVRHIDSSLTAFRYLLMSRAFRGGLA